MGELTTTSLPEHWVRSNVFYQLFCRLARPALDWQANLNVFYTMIAQPFFQHKFDPGAAALALGFALTVYGIKGLEQFQSAKIGGPGEQGPKEPPRDGWRGS